MSLYVMKVDNIRYVRSFVLKLRTALNLFFPIFNNNNEDLLTFVWVFCLFLIGSWMVCALKRMSSDKQDFEGWNRHESRTVAVSWAVRPLEEQRPEVGTAVRAVFWCKYTVTIMITGRCQMSRDERGKSCSCDYLLLVSYCFLWQTKRKQYSTLIVGH